MKILLVVWMLVLSGCESEPVWVFAGKLDRIKTHFKADVFVCNSSDLFVYRYDDNTALLNADFTQVSCTPTVFARYEFDQSAVPIYGG